MYFGFKASYLELWYAFPVDPVFPLLVTLAIPCPPPLPPTRWFYLFVLLFGDIPVDFFLIADCGRLPSIDSTEFCIYCTII